MRRLVAVAAALLAMPAIAQAMDKRTFVDALLSGDAEVLALVRVHFRGVANGLESANMFLRRRGDAPLFCLPEGTLIDPQWLVDETRTYVEQFDKIPDEVPIAVVATFVLQDAYACPDFVAE